jgi:hypothetical protein
VRDAYHRYNPDAALGQHIWDSGKRKWNGNLHGKRSAAKGEHTFPQHPECDKYNPVVFGKPSMSELDNYSVPGYTTPAPPKPAGYELSVNFSGDGAMGVSDEEEYTAMDFGGMDAGACLS